MSVRRRWWIVLCLSLTAAIMVALFLLTTASRGPVIAPEVAERLQPGITEAEAEAIIGMPPGDYTTHSLNIQLKPEAADERRWYTDAGVHALFFDADGKMYAGVHYKLPSELWLERLRQRLGF
jgi:hypothetical protein